MFGQRSRLSVGVGWRVLVAGSPGYSRCLLCLTQSPLLDVRAAQSVVGGGRLACTCGRFSWLQRLFAVSDTESSP